MRVSNASRRAAWVTSAPASVHAIHRDPICALGIRTLAEALRLAPNVCVVQVNASNHACWVRRLNTSFDLRDW